MKTLLLEPNLNLDDTQFEDDDLNHAVNFIMKHTTIESMEILQLLISHDNFPFNEYLDNFVKYHIHIKSFFKLEIMKMLMNHPKFDINKYLKSGLTTLMWACHNNEVDIVKHLLSQSIIEVNKTTENDLRTAFMYACMNTNHCPIETPNKIKTVSILLKHTKINVNMKDKNGKTAAKYACETHSTRVLELLISYQ